VFYGSVVHNVALPPYFRRTQQPTLKGHVLFSPLGHAHY